MLNVTRSDTLVRLQDDEARSEVTLSPARGGIVTQFTVAGRHLLYLDEATLNDATKNVRGGIPLLFPSPGKLDDDRFMCAGFRGALKQHGFARDLPWEVCDTGTEGAASVTLTLAANERTRAVYPWDFTAQIKISLRGSLLRYEIRVTNTGKDTMPFAFGTHPYFRVADKAGARIATKATHAFDNVSKQTVSFTGFDLTAAEVDLHLLDHGSTESTLTGSDGSEVKVRGSLEFGRWVVWTLAGKEFVCLEPWTAPGNALNTGVSVLLLAPGRSRDLWLDFDYRPGEPAPAPIDATVADAPATPAEPGPTA